MERGRRFRFLLDTGTLITGKAVGDTSTDSLLRQCEPDNAGTWQAGNSDQAEEPQQKDDAVGPSWSPAVTQPQLSSEAGRKSS